MYEGSLKSSRTQEIIEQKIREKYIEKFDYNSDKEQWNLVIAT